MPVDDLEALRSLELYDARQLAETSRQGAAALAAIADGDTDRLLDRSGTQLAEAVTTAAALIPEDRVGRVLLISDGLGTSGRRARRDRSFARARDPGPTPSPLATTPRPAHLASVSLSEVARAGAAAPAVLEVLSSQAETLELTIREGAGDPRTVPIEVSRGRSFVELDLSFDDSGDLPLRLEVEGTDQRLVATVPVAPALRMLVMESGEPSRELWGQLSESGWQIDRQPVGRPSAPR